MKKFLIYIIIPFIFLTSVFYLKPVNNSLLYCNSEQASNNVESEIKENIESQLSNLDFSKIESGQLELVEDIHY